jgi:hypothetical protein
LKRKKEARWPKGQRAMRRWRLPCLSHHERSPIFALAIWATAHYILFIDRGTAPRQKRKKEMTDEVFTAAANFREILRNLGEPVGVLDNSTNRYGEFSSYFSIGGGLRVRVSDHHCNTDFRSGELQVYYTHATREYAIDMLAQVEANTVAHQEAQARKAIEVEQAKAEAVAKAEISERRYAWWTEQIGAPLTGPARRAATKKLYNEGVRCPF